MYTQQSVKVQIDPYKGVHVLICLMPLPQFKTYLLNLQSNEQFRSIWVYLNSLQCEHLSLCLNQLGYKIHHGKDKQIVIYKWLRQTKDKTVPYSMFCVAAGALVIQHNKVLLVQEKSGTRKGRYGLPGGRADQGQRIDECAARQLFEETGLKGKLKRIVYFREITKNQNYGCVDLYFICMMELIQQGQVKICPREIADFKWVPLENYAQFCKENSVGTQLLVSDYVSQLYRENKLFQNFSYETELNIQKGLCQHRL